MTSYIHHHHPHFKHIPTSTSTATSTASTTPSPSPSSALSSHAPLPRIPRSSHPSSLPTLHSPVHSHLRTLGNRTTSTTTTTPVSVSVSVSALGTDPSQSPCGNPSESSVRSESTGPISSSPMKALVSNTSKTSTGTSSNSSYSDETYNNLAPSMMIQEPHLQNPSESNGGNNPYTMAQQGPYSTSGTSSSTSWAPEDDDALREVMATTPGRSWPEISKRAFANGKHNKQDCMDRWRMISKPKATKGPWTTDEDQFLVDLVQELGPEKWVVIASKLGTRTGKQCRERWHNHLDPSISKVVFTPEEDETIFFLYAKWGSKWAEIAKHLPGRPDNMIKNHFNTSLQRQKRRIRQRDLDQQSPIYDANLPRFVPYARTIRTPSSPKLGSPLPMTPSSASSSTTLYSHRHSIPSSRPLSSSNRYPHRTFSDDQMYESERFTPPSTPDLAHTPSTYGVPSASPRGEYTGYFPTMPASSCSLRSVMEESPIQSGPVVSLMNVPNRYTTQNVAYGGSGELRAAESPMLAMSPQRLPLPPSPPFYYHGHSTFINGMNGNVRNGGSAHSPEMGSPYHLPPQSERQYLHLPSFPYNDSSSPPPPSAGQGLASTTLPPLPLSIPFEHQQQPPSSVLRSVASDSIQLLSPHHNYHSPDMSINTRHDTISQQQQQQQQHHHHQNVSSSLGYSPTVALSQSQPFDGLGQGHHYHGYSSTSSSSNAHQQDQFHAPSSWSPSYSSELAKETFTSLQSKKPRQSLLTGALQSLPLSPPDSLTNSSNGSIRSRASSLISPLIGHDERSLAPFAGGAGSGGGGLQSSVESIKEEEGAQWSTLLPPLPLPHSQLHLQSQKDHIDIGMDIGNDEQVL